VEEVDADGRRRVTEYDDEMPATTDSHDYPEVGQERVVHADPWDSARSVFRTIGFLALAVLIIVETLLGFRLGFLAAGANPANGFVDFIYDSTNWLVDPFEGIVSNEAVDGGGVFDWATLIAMVVYAVAFLLFLVALTAISSFSPPTDSRSTVTQTSRREHSAH
jgi:hypothetical protein